MMKILWCLLFVSTSATYLQHNYVDIADTYPANDLLTNILQLHEATLKVDNQKFENLFEELNCFTLTEDILIEKVNELSTEVGEKFREVYYDLKRRYNAVGTEGKKFVDYVIGTSCIIITEKDKYVQDMMENHVIMVLLDSYTKLAPIVQDDIGMQFPIITLIIHLLEPKPKEKVERALYAVFPQEYAEFLKAVNDMDRKNLSSLVDELDLYNCSVTRREFFNTIKTFSPELSQKTQIVDEIFLEKYEVLGDKGKKFFDQVKSQFCSLRTSKDERKRSILAKDLVMTTVLDYLSLDKEIQDDIHYQFPVLHFIGAYSEYYVKRYSEVLADEFQYDHVLSEDLFSQPIF